MKEKFTIFFQKLTHRLSKLSFRTGIIVLCICVLCYAISFLQFLLPISIAAKGTLWFIFFGLAKATQYTGILIIGADGLKRLKHYLKRKDK